MNAGHLHPVPRIAVAGLIEPDALVHQRIIHRDRLHGDRPALFKDGQRAVVRLHGSIVVVVDPEFVHVEVKITLRDMIGLALQADAEFLEPPIAADEPAQHDHGGAEMGHVRAHASHHALGRVQRGLLGIVLGQHAIALPDQHFGDPFRHARLGAGHWDRRGVLHALDERQPDVHLVLLHRAPDGRESLVETGEGVDAEQG